MAPGFHPSYERKGDGVMTDFEILSIVMMVITLVSTILIACLKDK